MTVQQGDIYWIDLEEAAGSEPGYRHPYVVIQNNVFNQSRIGTAIVCALTSNLRLADRPGNVLLDAGEAGLPRRSVVNVSQVFTVDKGHLSERLGTLSTRRVREILRGLNLVLEPREPDDG